MLRSAIRYSIVDADGLMLKQQAISIHDTNSITSLLQSNFMQGLLLTRKHLGTKIYSDEKKIVIEGLIHMEG